MSPAQQHNLHLTYREILAKSSVNARSQAFAQLVAKLPEEELEYLEGLVARDLHGTALLPHRPDHEDKTP